MESQLVGKCLSFTILTLKPNLEQIQTKLQIKRWFFFSSLPLGVSCNAESFGFNIPLKALKAALKN